MQNTFDDMDKAGKWLENKPDFLTQRNWEEHKMKAFNPPGQWYRYNPTKVTLDTDKSPFIARNVAIIPIVAVTKHSFEDTDIIREEYCYFVKNEGKWLYADSIRY